MENIKEVLEKIKVKLSKKLTELDALETEKKDIIKRFKNAGDKEKILIEKEIKKSTEKFKKLSEEVLALKNKVDELKKINY